MIRRRQRREPFDVMFYVPSLTPLLSDGGGHSPGGAQTQVMLLARALAARGVRICLVVFARPGEPTPRLDGVTIVERPPYRGYQRLVGKLREAAAIFRSVAGVDAPVVVTRGCGVEVGLLAVAARLLGRRFVYSSASTREFDFEALQMPRRDLLLFRLGLRLADEVVVQSEEQLQLCRQRFDRTPLVVKSIAEEAERRGRPEALLWVGRLAWVKDPLAFVELARALPDVRFRMVVVPTPASGSLGEEVEAAATELPNLEVRGPTPRAEVLDLIDRAVAVVNTSRFEGMPNATLEGWARGVPALMLSCDPDGVVERYGLGELAHGSGERLAASARKLWDGRHDQADVAARCRRYVAEEHSEHAAAERWQRALGLVAASSPRRLVRGGVQEA